MSIPSHFSDNSTSSVALASENKRWIGTDVSFEVDGGTRQRWQRGGGAGPQRETGHQTGCNDCHTVLSLVIKGWGWMGQRARGGGEEGDQYLSLGNFQNT